MIYKNGQNSQQENIEITLKNIFANLVEERLLVSLSNKYFPLQINTTPRKIYMYNIEQIRNKILYKQNRKHTKEKQEDEKKKHHDGM